jgi:hypothetical protein
VKIVSVGKEKSLEQLLQVTGVQSRIAQRKLASLERAKSLF